ncbi:MAG: hypothetical protein V4649_06475 [Bacteroidota bacterium]
MNFIEDIVKNSGDSTVDKYSYSEGALILELDLTEVERKIRITIKTAILSFSNDYFEKNDSVYRTCMIEIQELADVVSTENNIYVPPKKFADIMKDSRLNYNLAYGKRKSDIKYIFSLVGYDRLISCLLIDLNCIGFCYI